MPDDRFDGILSALEPATHEMGSPVSLDLGGCTNSENHLVKEEEHQLLALEVCLAIVLKYCIDDQVKKLWLLGLKDQEVAILVLEHEDVLGSLHLSLRLHLSHELSFAHFAVSDLKDVPRLLERLGFLNRLEVHLEKAKVRLLEAMCEPVLRLSDP